jgi:hypothetical protein
MQATWKGRSVRSVLAVLLLAGGPVDFGTEIGTTIEISFDGSTPVDVTAYTLNSGQLVKTWGRGENSDTAPPSSVRFTLVSDKGDPGQWNPEDPSADYWQPNGWLGAPVTIEVEDDPAWYVGKIAGMEPRWDQEGDIGYLDVEVKGDRHWLAQNKPRRSPLARSILAASPVTYWPLTDGKYSTLGGQITTGGTGLFTPLGSGLLKFAQVDGPDGATEKLPEAALNTAGLAPPALTATVTGDTGDSWTIEYVARTVPQDGSGINWKALTFNTGHMRWMVEHDYTDPNYRIVVTGSANDDDGADTFFNPTGINLVDGEWHQVRIVCEDNSGTITTSVYVDDVLVDTPQTEAGAAGRVTDVTVWQCYQSYASNASVGHIAVYSGEPASMYEAFLGYVGETAGDRITRVAGEEGVTVTVVSGDTLPLGRQPTGNIIEVLEDAEQGDLGRLVDRAGPIVYVPRAARYNATAQLALSPDDLFAGPRPRYLASDRTGQVELTREGGSTLVVGDTDAMSAGGTVKPVTISSEDDSRLPDLAYWILGLGRRAGSRIGTIVLRLDAAVSFTLAGWQALTDPIRITVAGVTGLPNGLDVFVEGGAERINNQAKEWEAEFAVSQADPYRVSVIEGAGDTAFRVECEGQALTSDVAVGTATSFLVSTTDGYVSLGVDDDDMPCDFDLEGAQVRVTDVAGTGVTAFRAVGTFHATDNAPTGPGLPTGWQAGDLLVLLSAIRNAGVGSPVCPDGWTPLVELPNVALYGRIAEADDTAPTCTYMGGVSGATCSARITAFDACSVEVLASNYVFDGAAQDIATPTLELADSGPKLVIWIGWKQATATAVGAPAGSTLAFGSFTDVGDDQTIALAYATTSDALDISALSFSVTGGVAAINRGGIIALRGNTQTCTCQAAAINGVTKTASAGTAVKLWRPAGLAL